MFEPTTVFYNMVFTKTFHQTTQKVHSTIAKTEKIVRTETSLDVMHYQSRINYRRC